MPTGTPGLLPPRMSMRKLPVARDAERGQDRGMKPAKKDVDATSLREFLEWGYEFVPAEEWIDTLELVHRFLGLSPGRSPNVVFHEHDIFVRLNEIDELLIAPPSPN